MNTDPEYIGKAGVHGFRARPCGPSRNDSAVHYGHIETLPGPRLLSAKAHIWDMGVAAKICGLSSEEAVAAAVEGGAAYLGFVFYPPSPRSVSPARAAALCAELSVLVSGSVRRVGLFVDAEDGTIEMALAAAPLDILQF